MNWADIIKSDDWKAFIDGTVKGIFSNLNSDAKRVQAWRIVQELMERHPRLDVYTHTYKDLQKGRSAIVFGRKIIGSRQGYVCFMLIQNKAELPKLELGVTIDGIKHNNPSKERCVFTVADTAEKITSKIDELFSSYTVPINNNAATDRNHHLPRNYKPNHEVVPN